MTWLATGAIGLVAGVISGIFGVGGAVVIIPGLVLLLGLNQHTAHGTSLGALLLPVGLLGVIEYYRRGQVRLELSAVIAVGLFLGVWLGAKLAGQIPELMLRRAFGVFLLLVSLRLLVR